MPHQPQVGTAFGTKSIRKAMKTGRIAHRTEACPAIRAAHKNHINSKYQKSRDDDLLDNTGSGCPGEQSENHHAEP